MTGTPLLQELAGSNHIYSLSSTTQREYEEEKSIRRGCSEAGQKRKGGILRGEALLWKLFVLDVVCCTFNITIWPVQSYRSESWPKTPFISFIVTVWPLKKIGNFKGYSRGVVLPDAT